MLIRSSTLLLLVARVSLAQGTPPVTPPAPTLAPALAIVDTTPVPFERPNGTLLRPGTVTYDLSATRAGATTLLGVRTVQVAESSVAGTPAWLLTESRTGSAVATSDSLYLTRAELMPIHWSATSGRAALAASFSHDTAFGGLQSYQGRSSFTMPQAGTALVTPGMVERIVEMLPLRTGYRALASLLVVEIGAPRVQPAQLMVEREDSLQVADRRVDCWVVTLRSGATDERLWVTKEVPRVVKTEQSFGDAVLTSMLHVDPPAVPPAVAPDSSARPPVKPPVTPPRS